jgi:glucose-1-phosphate adenylyltransferase
MGADYYQSIEEMQSEIAEGIPHIGIGSNTVIRRAIIDKNARIGANVRLVNESGIENADGPDGSYYIRDRIILVPKNATVKDGTIA